MPTDGSRPYEMEIEFAEQTGLTLLERGPARFGDQFRYALSWTAGGKRSMNSVPIRVPVLGTKDDAFFCPPDLFFRAAFRMGGDPVFEPPPFACPCTDGLLIIYTFKRNVEDDSIDVHGGYILVTRRELEEIHADKPICTFWQRAKKPQDTATLLQQMGFGEVRPRMLN